MANIGRLPGGVAARWEWQLVGACRGADASLFFHPEGERGRARDERDAAAKAVCARCPVTEQCLTTALQTQEPYGVWGGTTEDERAEMLAGRRALARAG